MVFVAVESATGSLNQKQSLSSPLKPSAAIQVGGLLSISITAMSEPPHEVPLSRTVMLKSTRPISWPGRSVAEFQVRLPA